MKNLSPKTYHLKPRGGYALTLAIVVSSVVLSIGLSLLNIVQKELILSGTGRDSQFAFYAADAGLECVLYWDIHEQAFPSSGADWASGEPAIPGTGGDGCGSTDFSDSISQYTADLTDDGGTVYGCTTTGDPPVTTCAGDEDDTVAITLQVDFSNSGDTESHGSCAQIDITKWGNGESGDGYEVKTMVRAQGYNDACKEDGTFDNPALVERGISVSY